MKSHLVLLALVLSAFRFPLSAFSQGLLTPPGAPAPTFKTLQQVEPRIDLQNAPASAVDTANASFHFVINEPGSYYLSANVGVTKINGIRISSVGVTLDLNGFHISRASDTGGDGIQIINSDGASVRNGSIRGFNRGVATQVITNLANSCRFTDLSVTQCTSFGIAAGRAAVVESCRVHENSGIAGLNALDGSTLLNCLAHNNTVTSGGITAGSGSALTNCAATLNQGNGIQVGAGSSLNNCTASANTGTYGIIVAEGSSLANCTANNNGGSYGIFAGAGSTLTHCTAHGNDVEFGIRADDRSTLSNCTASVNTSAATISWGISAGNFCTVSNCTASGNLNTSGTPSDSTGGGIFAGGSSTVQNCTVVGNKGDGIQISGDSRVVGNNCDSNGNGGNAAGIHSTGADNRIEGNNVTDNTRGIDVDSSGSLIIKNSASGNPSGSGAANYDIATGNACLVVVTALTGAPFTGASGGTAVGSTDPWVNFSF